MISHTTASTHHTAEIPPTQPIVAWRWPPCPSAISIYDKYANLEGGLRILDDVWAIPNRGRIETLAFATGEVGLLQRKLTVLTQIDSAPSTLSMFARCLIKHWGVYEKLLVGGPSKARDFWNATVVDVTAAKAGKMLLKLVCRLELGGWAPLYLPLVRSLDTRAKMPLLAQRGKLKRREKLLLVSTQADIVSVLDAASANLELQNDQVEGLAALALFFQHGMRPVQLLALRLEHVPPPVTDATGDPALVVSYHAAKQRGTPKELLRQVKPEWVSLVNRLRTAAIDAGRERMFSCSSADELWMLVKDACKRQNLKVDFKAYGVRHTSAQSLADAGHDRKSIQEFLGHSSMKAATTYLRASRQQGELVNKALGTSKLYEDIVAISMGSFIGISQLLEAGEDHQIGAIVGSRLVAGIGVCRSGQSSCAFNPVTSCYGCSRFLPAVDAAPHQEAIAGMREQVEVYLVDGSSETSPAFLQLSNAISGAQQALELIARIGGNSQ